MADVGSERDRARERARSTADTSSAAHRGPGGGNPGASGTGDATHGHGHTAGAEEEREQDNPIQDVLADLGELKTWGQHLLAAKLDGVKLKIRHLMFLALFAVVGLTTGAALMITGAVLLLSGLAEAVGTWLESPWLGKVLVAAVFFAILIVAVLVVYRSVVNRFRTHLQKKYDALHARQRIHHGIDVEQRAHDLAREEKHAG